MNNDDVCIEIKSEELKDKISSFDIEKEEDDYFCGDVKDWMKLFDRNKPMDIEDPIEEKNRYLKYKDLDAIFQGLVNEGFKEGIFLHGKEFNSCVKVDGVSGYDIVDELEEDKHKDIDFMIGRSNEFWTFCARNDEEMIKLRELIDGKDRFKELLDEIDDYLGK